jgi:urea transport system substrate-binding protein
MELPSIKCMTFALLVCCAGLIASAGADAAEPIRVGAVLPFSGGVELYGRQAKLGLDLAVKDINAAGGILGRPVEVIYADDETRPESAVTAMRALIERDGVVAVVGPITSQNLNAIAPVAESLKTPLLYATNYEGGKCSRYFFSFGTVTRKPTIATLSRSARWERLRRSRDANWPIVNGAVVLYLRSLTEEHFNARQGSR